MKKALAVIFAVLGSAVFAQSPTHQVQLSWSAPITTLTITGYNVYRLVGACPVSPSLSAFTKLNTSAVVPVAFTDTTVTAGTMYCYTVTALTAGSESGIPGVLQVTIPTFTAINVPPPVGNFAAAAQ